MSPCWHIAGSADRQGQLPHQLGPRSSPGAAVIPCLEHVASCGHYACAPALWEGTDANAPLCMRITLSQGCRADTCASDIRTMYQDNEKAALVRTFISFLQHLWKLSTACGGRTR